MTLFGILTIYSYMDICVFVCAQHRYIEYYMSGNNAMNYIGAFRKLIIICANEKDSFAIKKKM